MSLLERCPRRRSAVPRYFPCSCKKCTWYIDKKENANCFWSLAKTIEKEGGLSIVDIARLENVSVDTIDMLIQLALDKLRNTHGRNLKLLQFGDNDQILSQWCSCIENNSEFEDQYFWTTFCCTCGRPTYKKLGLNCCRACGFRID